MLRSVFNLAAGASAGLFIATLALWIATYWYYIQIWYGVRQNDQSVNPEFTIAASGNAMVFGLIPVLGPSEIPEGWSAMFYPHPGFRQEPPWMRGWWFRFDFDGLQIPYWAIVLVAAVLPAVWIRRVRRQRTAKAGLCPTCGYDLRATPDRCPECGRICKSGVKESGFKGT